jgi:hypothetical protein
VAPGEPSTPVTCWAMAGTAASMVERINARIVGKIAFVFISCLLVKIYYNITIASQKEHFKYIHLKLKNSQKDPS